MTQPIKFGPILEHAVEAASENLKSKVREAAVDEALIKRGQPVEVTVEDIGKVAERIVVGVSGLPRAETVLYVFGWAGILISLVGIMIVCIKSLLENIDAAIRIPCAISLIGITVALVSFGVRMLIRRQRRRAILERSREQ